MVNIQILADKKMNLPNAQIQAILNNKMELPKTINSKETMLLTMQSSN